jgi:hypothetical protein
VFTNTKSNKNTEKYLFAMSDFSKYSQIPGLGYLIILSGDGDLIKFKKIENPNEASNPGILSPMNAGLFFYVSAKITDSQCCKSEIYFLNKDLEINSEIKKPEFIGVLDYHSIFYSRKKNTIFYQVNLFDNFKLQKNYLIIEKNIKGKNQFSFNTEKLRNGNKLYDPFDLNFVDFNESNKTVLLSFKASSEILAIDYNTKKIKWRFPTSEWKFINDPNGGFLNQHSVKSIGNGNILLFDNGNNYLGRHSRAVEYHLDFKAKTAKLVWQFEKYFGDGFSEYGGSVTRLENGNTLISWGNSSPMSPKKYLKYVVWNVVNPSGEIVKEFSSEDNFVTYYPTYEKR